MSPRPQPARQVPASSRVAQELSHVFFDLLMRHKILFAQAVADHSVCPPCRPASSCASMQEAPCTMSAVAQELGCGPSNITRLIDKLEARALVERRAHPDDRRIKSLAMTRKGAALRRRLMERLARPAPWMQALSPDDQRQLVGILRRALSFASADA